MNKKKVRIIFLMMVGISLLLFGGMRSLSYPAYIFLRVQNIVMQPVKHLIERAQRISELEKLVETLGQEKEALLAQNISLNASLCLVGEIQELLDFQKTYSGFQAHLTHILLKQFSDKGHYYIVDRGSKHGAVVGMVVVYKNCLVGRIDEVYPFFSKVVLITDPCCKVPVVCSETKTQGICEGINDERMIALAYVSHLDLLKKDDLVISSGQGLIFPQGLGLGKISSYECDGVYYTILLAPLLDLRSLSYCYLLQKGEEKI